MKENKKLELKIKDCEESLNKIKQNMNEQKEMRRKQTEEIQNMINGLMEGKLTELNKETDKYDEENKKFKKNRSLKCKIW